MQDGRFDRLQCLEKGSASTPDTLVQKLNITRATQAHRLDPFLLFVRARVPHALDSSDAHDAIVQTPFVSFCARRTFFRTGERERGNIVWFRWQDGLPEQAQEFKRRGRDLRNGLVRLARDAACSEGGASVRTG